MIQIQKSFESSKQQAQAAQSTNITTSNGMWSFNTLGILTNINTSDPPSKDGQTQRWTDPKPLGIIRHIMSKNNRVGQVWVKTISNYFGFGNRLWQ